MDIKPADGRRSEFLVIATATPKLLVDAGGRSALVICNEGSASIRIGHSGTVSSRGMLLAANQGFTDNYSTDEWWVIATASSGTVSGFIVV